jgi:hypothetical protein
VAEQQVNRRPRGIQAVIFFGVFPIVLIGLILFAFQGVGDYRTFAAIVAAVAVNIYTAVMWFTRWRKE